MKGYIEGFEFIEHRTPRGNENRLGIEAPHTDFSMFVLVITVSMLGDELMLNAYERQKGIPRNELIDEAKAALRALEKMQGAVPLTIGVVNNVSGFHSFIDTLDLE